jgi:hypothetical protein
VPLRPRSDSPTYRREIEERGERNAQEQISASRSSRTRVLLVAPDAALVRVAFRLFCDKQDRLRWRADGVGDLTLYAARVVSASLRCSPACPMNLGRIIVSKRSSQTAARRASSSSRRDRRRRPKFVQCGLGSCGMADQGSYICEKLRGAKDAIADDDRPIQQRLWSAYLYNLSSLQAEWLPHVDAQDEFKAIVAKLSERRSDRRRRQRADGPLDDERRGGRATRSTHRGSSQSVPSLSHHSRLNQSEPQPSTGSRRNTKSG